MSRMTMKLKEVIERVQNWPEERREDAAKVLLEMEAQDASSFQLTDEQLAEVRRRRAEFYCRGLNKEALRHRAKRVEFRAGTCTNHRNDLFVKLKLMRCAPISGLPEIGFLCVRKSGRPDLRCEKPRRGFFMSGSRRPARLLCAQPGANRMTFEKCQSGRPPGSRSKVPSLAMMRPGLARRAPAA
jgi:hypothetical protein